MCSKQPPQPRRSSLLFLPLLQHYVFQQLQFYALQQLHIRKVFKPSVMRATCEYSESVRLTVVYDIYCNVEKVCAVKTEWRASVAKNSCRQRKTEGRTSSGKNSYRQRKTEGRASSDKNSCRQRKTEGRASS
eukprot:1067801-Prorocentrum_minimum.AAC.1